MHTCCSNRCFKYFCVTLTIHHALDLADRYLVNMPGTQFELETNALRALREQH